MQSSNRPVVSVRKPFDQRFHDEFDPPARLAVSKYLTTVFGATAHHNPDKYSTDLVVLEQATGNIGLHIEIENRDFGTANGLCPYPTIHVPYRKERIMHLRPLLYWIVTKSCFYICNIEDIVDHQPREIPNKHIANGEFFFDVPKTLFHQVFPHTAI